VCRNTKPAKNENLVAYIPDVMSFGLPLGEDGETINLGYLGAMGKITKGAVTFGSSNGWMELKVLRAADSEYLDYLKTRFDRKTMGDLLRSVQRDGRITMDAMARYTLASNPDDEFDSTTYAVQSICLRLSREPGQVYWDPDALRLYGRLSKGQLQDLRSGAKLRVQGLSKVLQAQFSQLLYGAENYELNFEPGPSAIADERVWRLFHEGILGEPTYRYPNGLPAGAVLTLTEENKPGIRCSAEGTGADGDVIDPESLGYHLWALEHPEPGDELSHNSRYTTYRPGTNRVLTFKIEFDLEVSRTFQLSEFTAAGPSVSDPSKLPKAMWEAVLAGKKAAEEQSKNPPSPMPDDPPRKNG
jgi:hypothetical protein